ncbi:hypothetical protein C8F01DRAFT_1231087 [Mycena amicta]|nr:hypothetical protein C8F01DRAFT_1231087 [Mycena amicta]
MNPNRNSGLAAVFTGEQAFKCAGCKELISPDDNWKYFAGANGLGGHRICSKCVPRFKCAGCNKSIHLDDNWKYFDRANGSGRQRVCSKCVPRYSKKEDTVPRNGNPHSHPPVQAQNLAPGYIQDVHRHVIDARQKGAARTTREVTPLPNAAMGPLVPNQLQISIPSTWKCSATAQYSHMPPLPVPMGPPPVPAESGPYGYSPAHSDWAVQRKIWQSKAYQSTSAPRVTLRFQLMRSVRTKAKGQLIGNIIEGVLRVSVDSLIRDIHKKGIEALHPKIMRELRGKTAVDLAFLIDADQWEQVEDFLDAKSTEATQRSSTRSDSESRYWAGESVPDSPEAEPFGLVNTEFTVSRSQMASSAKRIRSDSSTEPTTPPQRKRPVQYQSPDHQRLRAALEMGGSSASQLSGQGISLNPSLIVELMFPQVQTTSE